MPTSLTMQATHTTTAEWLWVIGAVAVAVAVATALVITGRPRDRWTPVALLERAGSSLTRVTGLPAWSAGGVVVHSWALLVAGVGFYWDVAWHIDLGRDGTLFTPPHVLILIGLLGIAAAGVVSVVFATRDRVEHTWRAGMLRVPPGAGALVVLGLGAAIGFPIDDLWHRTYGIDVTMWSPTHLIMIGAAALSPIGAWLLLGAAGPSTGRPRVRRALVIRLAVLALLAFAGLQLEFDDGVPQWQALYEPVLIAVAATLPLVAARIAIGRGAALTAALLFLVARTAMALVIGPGLGHTMPHFPLYVGIALCVEAAFAVAGRRGLVVAALLAGALSGTLGLASEWGFSHVFSREPWQPELLQGIWLATIAAVAASILGAGFGAVVAGRGRRIAPALLAAAGIAVVGVLAVPLPRAGLPLTATVRTTPAGPKQIAVDRYGEASLFQQVRVAVDVSPSDAAALRGADWFWVISWQGGGRQANPLVEVAPGHWVSTTPSPTGAAWKTMVFLAKRDVVASIPVSMPADPASRLSAIPVQAARTQQFVPASTYLTRESHGGAEWPAILADATVLTMVVTWILVLIAATVSLARSSTAGRPLQKRPAPSRSGALAWRRSDPKSIARGSFDI